MTLRPIYQIVTDRIHRHDTVTPPIYHIGVLLLVMIALAGACTVQYVKSNRTEHVEVVGNKSSAVKTPVKNNQASSPSPAPQPDSTSITTTSSSTSAAATKTSAQSPKSDSETQSNNDTINQINWENTMCITPEDKINASVSTAIQQNQNTAQAGRNAISYAPGTSQYHSAYNSVAFAYNFNIDLIYENTYLSGINALNASAHCNLPIAWQKPAYWNMLDTNGNYVPYVEGSSLYNY